MRVPLRSSNSSPNSSPNSESEISSITEEAARACVRRTRVECARVDQRPSGPVPECIQWVVPPVLRGVSHSILIIRITTECIRTNGRLGVGGGRIVVLQCIRPARNTVYHSCCRIRYRSFTAGSAKLLERVNGATPWNKNAHRGPLKISMKLNRDFFERGAEHPG